MIKVFYGKKGSGKTKALVEGANTMVKEVKGDVVFIDDSTQLMYDLKHEIRFINASEFPVRSTAAFSGFICGIIAEDYDIEGIFIDGLNYIVKESVDTMKVFFDTMAVLAEKYNVNFYLSINGDMETAPDFVKQYMD